MNDSNYDGFSYPDNFKDGTKAPKARPDENMVEEHCVEGPDWKPGTCPPSHPIDKMVLVNSDEGQHDEVTSYDTTQFGADYGPYRGRR